MVARGGHFVGRGYTTKLGGKTNLCVDWVIKLFFVLTEVHMYTGILELYNSYPTTTRIHTSNNTSNIFLSLYYNKESNTKICIYNSF